MRDICNNDISTEKELKSALIKFGNNNSYEFNEDVFLTALFLNEENERRFKKTGVYWFLPRALTPLAYEAWWQLQHNIDSYGCDYEWVYSEDGMRDILVEQEQCDLSMFGETDEDFIEYWNIV